MLARLVVLARFWRDYNSAEKRSYAAKKGSYRGTVPLADHERARAASCDTSNLELAGLVTTEKVGRVRTCHLGPCRLEEEMALIARYRQVWEVRFKALDGVIDELRRQEKARVRKKRR